MLDTFKCGRKNFFESFRFFGLIVFMNSLPWGAPKYEGITKSSQTELIMKYMFILVILHYWPLQSNSLMSLCNRFNIAATARNAIGKLRVWRSTFVPEFYKCPVNNTLLAVISFSQISRCHKVSNYMDKGNGRLELCF